MKPQIYLEVFQNLITFWKELNTIISMIEIVTGILSLNLEYRTPAKFIKNNLILCHANEMLMPNSNLSIFDKDRFEFFILLLLFIMDIFSMGWLKNTITNLLCEMIFFARRICCRVTPPAFNLMASF